MIKIDNHSRYAGFVVILQLCIIGIAYMLVPGGLPLMGDDATYLYDFQEYYGGSWLYYPRWIIRHWYMFNGRVGNLLAPIYFSLPPLVWSAVYACSMVAMLMLMFRHAGMRLCNSAGCMCVIAAVILGLQWWDAFMLYIVMLNYVFATVLVLWFLLLFLRHHNYNDRLSRAGVYFLAILGGMSHEAAALPVVAGILVWLVIVPGRWSGIGSTRRIMLVIFTVCTFAARLSPAFFHRLGSEPDDTMTMLVVRSCYMALVLIALTAIIVIVNPQVIKRLLPTSWTIFAVAAVASLPIVAVGGIVGRSGLFCQVYALIAIAMLVMELMPRIPRVLGAAITTVLFIAVSSHLAALVYWQRKVAREAREVVTLFKASSDGTVYYDYTRYDQIPWYVLGKTQGVTDEDDIYLTETINHYYGDSIKQLIILPTALWQHDSAVRDATLPHNAFLSEKLPTAYIATDIGLGRYLLWSQGQPEMIAVPIELNDKHMYYITPRVPHPENPVVRR